MGMFDYVEWPLAVPSPYNGGDLTWFEWQTKDFDCEIKTYRIDEYGQLFKLVYDHGGTRKYNPVDYTGPLHFYDYTGDLVDGGLWVDVWCSVKDGYATIQKVGIKRC